MNAASNPLSIESLRAGFERGAGYSAYVGAGKPNERENWAAFHARVQLTAAQRGLVGAFERRINVLCVSGTWCGDCVQQCPFLDHIAGAGPAGLIEVRFLERDGSDANKALSDALKICGGNRVPVMVFMNEDFEFVGLAGDRTLNRYRAIAARKLGAACPLPGAPVPPDEIATQLADWVDEFERVHLLLRLSPKLRARYGD